MDRSQSLSLFDQLVAGLQNHRHLPQAATMIQKAEIIYLLAPSSFLGLAFASTIGQQLSSGGKKIVLVDDTLSASPPGLADCEILGTQAFIQAQPVAGLAINLANTPFVHGYFTNAASIANIPIVDIIPVLDALGRSRGWRRTAGMRPGPCRAGRRRSARAGCRPTAPR